MSESELTQILMSSSQIILSIFSIFFALISGYIVGLFYFLSRAPLTLKLLAFALLSVGFVFLGVAATIQESVQIELFAALHKLPSPTVSAYAFYYPAPNLPFDFRKMGSTIGWFTATGSYLALGYMTFLHRWRKVGDPIGADKS